MQLGKVLRKWRVGSELPLREVADEIGIHFSTLARIEKGLTPPADALIKIVLWLVKPEEATNGTDPAKGEGLGTVIALDGAEDSDGKGQ